MKKAAILLALVLPFASCVSTQEAINSDLHAAAQPGGRIETDTKVAVAIALILAPDTPKALAYEQAARFVASLLVNINTKVDPNSLKAKLTAATADETNDQVAKVVQKVTDLYAKYFSMVIPDVVTQGQVLSAISRGILDEVK